MRALADPHGSFLPSLLYFDVRDRLGGRSASANARWGWLSRPAHAGKLIWIASGTSRKSVQLGVELGRALVAKCPDVAVTLTYEAEYADLLAPLERAERMGWGYGPADYAPSVSALWRRLRPFGLIIAGHAPRRNLLGLAAIAPHALLVAPPIPVVGRFERVYPTHAAPCPGANSAPAADPNILLTQLAVDTRLAAAIEAGGERRLWWWHGSDLIRALRFIALFRGHVGGDVLVLSGPVCETLAKLPGTSRLSDWAGAPIDTGELLLADHARWFATIACAAGAHFAIAEPDALSQALAGGARVSTAGSVAVASPHLAAGVERIDDETDIAISWAALRADPLKARVAADVSRRAFATERRLAQNTVLDLIHRVQEWR